MEPTKVFLMAAFCAMIFFSAQPSQALENCTEPVETESGKVRGASETEADSCVWKGIPFAAPPVGELRWKAPAPHPSWPGIKDATEFGRQCMQVPNPLVVRKLGFSEDCLTLNIWSPKKSGSFPVLFWIHGGGLTIGSSASPMYYGLYLADKKDVVLVSINYRLGPFGFYSLKEFAENDREGLTSNTGLLDMVRGLEWVRDNISKFGGDPNSVTIFGESAGSHAVCNLLACPLAKGLFHKAIMESGGCGAESMDECNADGAVFAAAAGCEGPGTASCMMGKSADEIMDVVRKDSSVGQVFSSDRFDFGLCVDGRALEADPIEEIKAGRYNNVPIIAGTNRDEFKLFALISSPGYRLLPVSRLHAKSNNRFAPNEGSLDRYNELYPKSSYRRPADAWAAAVTDATFGCRGLEEVEASAPNQPATYYYRFDYDRHMVPHLLGAAHGLEIPFIFDTVKQGGLMAIYSKRQVKESEELVDIMMGYWTNFAKTGDPNGPGLPEWPAYNTKSPQRINLDLPTRAASADDIVEKCEFWAEQDAGW